MNSTDEQEKLEQLTRLQTDTKEREAIVFAMYGALLAFSGAALLALMTVTPQKYLTTATCCALLTSCLSFGTIVVSRVHVLHKGNHLHIGHVMVADDFSGGTHLLGITSLAIGVALFVWHISFYCALFFIAGLGFAFHRHIRFRRQFDALPTARQFIDRMASLSPTDIRDTGSR
jgi:hypothetical protein